MLLNIVNVSKLLIASNLKEFSIPRRTLLQDLCYGDSDLQQLVLRAPLFSKLAPSFLVYNLMPASFLGVFVSQVQLDLALWVNWKILK